MTSFSMIVAENRIISPGILVAARKYNFIHDYVFSSIKKQIFYRFDELLFCMLTVNLIVYKRNIHFFKK